MDAKAFLALAAPFAADEIEWRLQQAGEKNGRVWARCLAYVTNRAIMDRLDAVCGPDNWFNQYAPGPVGGLICGLTIRTEHGPVTKWDGAENTDVEGVKGGLSGAMKRAAVQWGIGRYLYGLEEDFARVNDSGRFRGKTKEGKPFQWDPPQLPKWALPEPQPKRSPAETPAAAIDPEPVGDGTLHDAMLQYVRRVGPQVADDAEIRINRRVRSLKEFVRENWAEIKEKPSVAKAVVEAIQSATGTSFDAERDAAAPGSLLPEDAGTRPAQHQNAQAR